MRSSSLSRCVQLSMHARPNVCLCDLCKHDSSNPFLNPFLHSSLHSSPPSFGSRIPWWPVGSPLGSHVVFLLVPMWFNVARRARAVRRRWYRVDCWLSCRSRAIPPLLSEGGPTGMGWTGIFGGRRVHRLCIRRCRRNLLAHL